MDGWWRVEGGWWKVEGGWWKVEGGGLEGGKRRSHYCSPQQSFLILFLQIKTIMAHIAHYLMRNEHFSGGLRG